MTTVNLTLILTPSMYTVISVEMNILYTMHQLYYIISLHYLYTTYFLLQTDMTLVVEQQVRGQLRQECAESVRRRSSIAADVKNNSDICTPTHNVMLQLLRDSSVY